MFGFFHVQHYSLACYCMHAGMVTEKGYNIYIARMEEKNIVHALDVEWTEVAIFSMWLAQAHTYNVLHSASYMHYHNYSMTRGD